MAYIIKSDSLHRTDPLVGSKKAGVAFGKAELDPEQ